MLILISGLWAATQPSGICRTIVNLITGLIQAAPTCRIVLVIGEWQRQYFEDALGLKHSNLEVVAVDISNHTLRRNAWYLFGLPRLASRLGVDIVHLAFPAPVIKSLFGCPLITTVHDLYPYDCPDNFRRFRVFGNRLTFRRALSASHHVVCVSEHTLARLQKRFPSITASKTSCISNAVFIASGAAEPQLTVRRPFLLAVAQHRANKQLGLLLQAFERYKSLSAQNQKLQLVIIGAPGPETPLLHKISERLGLRDAVMFRSNVPDGELSALYCNCELFVSLAKIEGFGLPLGEAISFGARALASDIPAHRQVGGESCEYVQLGRVGQADEIARAIEQAMQRAKPAKALSEQRAPAHAARQYFDLYKDVSTRQLVKQSSSFRSLWELR